MNNRPTCGCPSTKRQQKDEDIDAATGGNRTQPSDCRANRLFDHSTCTFFALPQITMTGHSEIYHGNLRQDLIRDRTGVRRF